MNIANLSSGAYVVAVSGGVDSVVLLDILAKKANLDLIVAHFDHGIREDSNLDAEFVEELSENYSLKFELGHGYLGKNASENTARRARYNFLKQVKKKHKASAIITAHHQDDLLETAIINLIRGTRWRGLASLRQTNSIIRPFLNISKYEITNYARTNQLSWREDSTNKDEKILRNFVRRKIMSRIRQEDKDDFLMYVRRQNQIRPQIESLLSELIKKNAQITSNSVQFDRNWLIMLPSNVCTEVLNEVHFMLCQKYVQTHTLKRMIWFCKTARLHKTLQVSNIIEIHTSPRQITVKLADS